MQIPQVRTVITTGHAMKNTYNQLSALQQEKHALQYNLDQAQHKEPTTTNRETMTHIEEKIVALNRQIKQVHSDQLMISDQAYALYQASN